MHETLKIKIDFAPKRQRPAEVFQAMGEYIEAYQAIGQVVINSLGHREEFKFQLETIETGSVASLLKTVSGNISEWLANILIQSGLSLAENLTYIDTTTSEEEVDKLASSLEIQISEAGTEQIADPKIDRKEFATALKKLSEANKKLLPEESVSAGIVGSEKIVPINTHWRFNANPKEMFLGTTTNHTITDKLYVKAPINIGKSAWSVVSITTHNSFNARICDLKWLEDYQGGLIPPIGPKDVMEAELSLDIYAPPPGKGKAFISKASILRIVEIHRDVGLQHETSPLC